MSLEPSARIAVQNCLNVRKEESLLIITDPSRERIGRALYNVGAELGAETILLMMMERTRHGEEPPTPVAGLMKMVDALIAPTRFSISHTQARKAASQVGVRIATMPGITEAMFEKGGMNADFQEIRRYCDALFERVKNGRTARIKTALGTNLTLGLEGRTWLKDTGILHEKGAFGNLPAGELFIPPVEGSSQGILVVDGAMAGEGKLKNPITFEIREGRVVAISGGEEAEKIGQILEKASGKLEEPGLVYNIAELGIGLNPEARLIGHPLEDEKVMGTVHVAVGDNSTFGGKTKAGVHMDGIVKGPTLTVDDEVVIEDGKLLV